MKKMLLTGAMALMGLMVSAQGFMVTADIDTDDLGNFDGITETLGFGYFVNDAFVVGAKMAGDEDMNLFARYYWNESLFLSATAPTERFPNSGRFIQAAGAEVDISTTSTSEIPRLMSFDMTPGIVARRM